MYPGTVPGYLQENGGGVMAASWVKVWRAVLGVFELEVGDNLC